MSNICITFIERELTLIGSLTQNTVELAKAQILKLLPSQQSIEVNLSKVTHCDSASLAFLMALLREAKKRHTTLTFSHMPKQMLDLGSVSGINHLLSLAD